MMKGIKQEERETAMKVYSSKPAPEVPSIWETVEASLHPRPGRSGSTSVRSSRPLPGTPEDWAKQAKRWRRLAYQAEWSRRRYFRRQLARICVRCGKRPIKTVATCGECP